MALLRSVPRLDRPRQARLDPVEGQPPDLTRLDAGCAFRPRCRFAVEMLRRRRGRRCEAVRRGRAARRLLPQPRGRARSRSGGMSAIAAAAPLLRGARSAHALPDHRGHRRAPQGRRGEGGGRHRLHRSAAARRWAWSAKAAAARPRRAAASCDWSGRPTGAILYDGVDIASLRPQGAAGAAPAHPGDLPGPVQLAEPAHEGRRRSSASR